MTLETRIARLERQARLYRNLFLASLLVLVVFLSLGQANAVPDAVKGHSFVVVDRETGAPLAILGQRASGGFLDLLERNTKRVVHLDIKANGDGQLTLCKPGGAMSRECNVFEAP